MEHEVEQLRREVASLRDAQATRTEIGQAMGIAMERFKLDAEPAFALLVRISQNHNVKLRDLAAEIVRTREIPAG